MEMSCLIGACGEDRMYGESNESVNGQFGMSSKGR